CIPPNLCFGASTMAKRPAKPDNQSWLSPYLVVKDADAALAFYEKAFGLKKKLSMPGPDGRTMHAEVLWHDITIMFGPEQPGQPAKTPASSGVRPAIGLYLYCEDVDAVYKRALAAGAKSDRAPQTMFSGDRVCAVIDPDGYLWSFGMWLISIPAKLRNDF